jgi:hypothetical protein
VTAQDDDAMSGLTQSPRQDGSELTRTSGDDDLHERRSPFWALIPEGVSAVAGERFEFRIL